MQKDLSQSFYVNFITVLHIFNFISNVYITEIFLSKQCCLLLERFAKKQIHEYPEKS